MASATVFAAGPDSTAPSLETAYISDNDGTELTLIYFEANSLDTLSTPVTTDFTITATNSGAITVSGVTVNADNTITLALFGAILVDDTVTLDYISGTNPIQDLTPNLAASFSGWSVTTSVIPYNSTNWTAISPSGGSQYDYFDDQPTGQGEGDIMVDDAANPAFQVHFDDNGNASNTDGTLSFRFRLARDGSNFYIVGIDADSVIAKLVAGIGQRIAGQHQRPSFHLYGRRPR